jgi:hypothetical protein
VTFQTHAAKHQLFLNNGRSKSRRPGQDSGEKVSSRDNLKYMWDTKKNTL